MILLRWRLTGLGQNLNRIATFSCRHTSSLCSLSSSICPRTTNTKSRMVSGSKRNIRCSSSTRILERFPIAVRDACLCDMCIDPHSGQKNFKTTDIPLQIRARDIKLASKGIEIEWSCDIPGFESHKSYISHEVFSSILSSNPSENLNLVLWNQIKLADNFPSLQFDYNEYLGQQNLLYQVVSKLKTWGIVFITGAPLHEKAVENIALRLGPIRNSFYGETWDVKSIPQAKNVAYTDKFLGLHQDLLYMENPPAIQLLHCIENSCKGGKSLFSDGFKAAIGLSIDDYNVLSREKISYHYQKDEQNYQYSHPVIENSLERRNLNAVPIPSAINYSPPFQAPFSIATRNIDISEFVRSLKNFTEGAESSENIFEYNLKPGDCVIFNNRRVFHGRSAFEAQTGKRRLRGCYIDHDVLLSRSRVLQKVFSDSQSEGA